MAEYNLYNNNRLLALIRLLWRFNTGRDRVLICRRNGFNWDVKLKRCLAVCCHRPEQIWTIFGLEQEWQIEKMEFKNSQRASARY